MPRIHSSGTACSSPLAVPRNEEALIPQNVGAYFFLPLLSPPRLSSLKKG